MEKVTVKCILRFHAFLLGMVFRSAKLDNCEEATNNYIITHKFLWNIL